MIPSSSSDSGLQTLERLELIGANWYMLIRRNLNAQHRSEGMERVDAKLVTSHRARKASLVTAPTILFFRTGQ